MNILITGSTGFIGFNLCNKLSKNSDLNLYALVRNNSKSDEFSALINIIEWNDGVDFEWVLTTLHIEGIIHLAGWFVSEHIQSDIKVLIESNVDFGTKIIDAAARAKVKWFINTASFWQHYNNIIDNPVNLYAATKQAFECILDFYRAAFPIRIMSLELADTYGPSDKRKKLINTLRIAIENQEVLLLSPGGQEINILYIDDVTNAYEVAISLIGNGEIEVEDKYCVAAESVLTLKELISLASIVFGGEISVIWGGRTYRVREYMSPKSVYPILPGWKQNISLEDGLKKILTKPTDVPYEK